MTPSDDSGEPNGGQALVAEFVLGLLDSAEHARVGRLIENDQKLRAERDFWQARFGALNSGYEDVPVPAHLINTIEARVFGTPAKTRVNIWDNLLVWRGLAAGALAVAVVAVGINVLTPKPDTAALATQLVAALSEDGSNVKFVALYDSSTGKVRLTSLSGEAVPEHDFELWAIQGGNNPVSMGVVPVNARSEVVVSPDILKGWGEGSVLAITLEAKGGSADGNPHGPIVAKGPVTQI
ncbi:anti-sigma factor domain-containing protein [Devosia sp.]|uniref:anti-sigma factor n=1 Tax=Devosia sp. TaxID=1871048 RepID=UPI0032638D1A